MSLKTNLMITLLACCVSGAVYAYDYDAELPRHWRDDPLSSPESGPQLSVKFDHFSSQIRSSQSPLARETSGESLVNAYRQHHRPVHKNITREYDATFFYPIRKHGMNLDLGINIRFLNGHSQATEDKAAQQFNQTLPMFYAAMLFDLPMKGFSAGFEGRHLETDNELAYEYRAKVRYEWSGGLGVQGGWQQQFLGLDRFGSTLNEYENEGPYLDLYLNF